MKFDGVCVGIISKPVGIKGLVKIHPYAESPSFFLKHSDFFLADGFEISLSGQKINQKSEIVATIKGFNDRTSVEQFRLKKLFVLRDQLPELSEDEFYLADLEGLAVLDKAEIPFGTVVAALDFGAGAFLEIESFSKTKNKIVTLPFNKDSILKVDLKSKQIVVNEDFVLS